MRAPKAANKTKPIDHRTRVGVERRSRTNARIIEAAVRIFAERGPDAAVIDDFIRAAGIARGTFYNYYQSTSELLEATSKWLEDDLITSIEIELANLDSPVDRLVMGVRLWLRRAEADAEWCAFSLRVRHHGELVEKALMRDLSDGLRAGLFKFPSVNVARDLVVGTIREAMSRFAEKRVRGAYGDVVTRVVLKGLGVRNHVIERAMKRPVPQLRRPVSRFT